MSTLITQAFTKQFEAEVFQAFQRMGSKLRGTVRTKTGVIGSSTIFQKVGKGIASTKSRHGNVPVMNLDHSNIEVVMNDYYAGDWVDKLDEIKTNIDERQVIANAGAYALGRKTDDMIIAAMSGATTTIASNTSGMTLAKVQSALETLGYADVPDDGDRYAIVGWSQWTDLLALPQFASADYVGKDELPFLNTQARKWLGTTWIPHSALPVASTVRTCYWYHKSAVAQAIGADVQSDITWNGPKASHFVNNMMSQGVGLIDGTGVVAINCNE
jgi:hypothetical protein